MLSGKQAQLNAMNGPARRSELSWITRARTSLPVPDDPPIRTVTSVFATREASASNCSVNGSPNTIVAPFEPNPRVADAASCDGVCGSLISSAIADTEDAPMV